MSGGGSIPGDFLILPRYPQAFANLRRLDIMTGVSKNDILHECCVPRFWAYACEKDSYRELMDHLADMGLQTEGLDIRFPCETTRPAGDFRMQNIRRYVLPHLQFVARQKAKLQAEVAGERRG